MECIHKAHATAYNANDDVCDAAARRLVLFMTSQFLAMAHTWRTALFTIKGLRRFLKGTAPRR